jgi:nucleotide-binding universal stress UspA family protein
MFAKVLIATDLSPASTCLLRCVGELKELGLKQAVLAHVIYVANTPGLENRMEVEDLPELRAQRQLLAEQGVEVVTAMPQGIVARELDALAEEHQVDAIVMATRGHGLLRSLLGSVAFKLLQIARRPLFLAPVRVLGEGDSCQVSVCLTSLQHVLVPVDFSENSAKVIAYLEQLLKISKVSVTLLHVIDAKFAEVNLSRRGLEDYRKLAADQLDALRQRLQQAGGLVEADLVYGTPWKEIVERTRGERFTLVLMGSHGKGFFQEAMLGSVANEVSRQTEVPVLFIPSIH